MWVLGTGSGKHHKMAPMRFPAKHPSSVEAAVSKRVHLVDTKLSALGCPEAPPTPVRKRKARIGFFYFGNKLFWEESKQVP